MSMKDLLATVKSNVSIAENIYAITLTLTEPLKNINGGQFVNLSVGEGAMLLRRPLGICKIDGTDLTLCYQVKGKGTKKLTEAKAGDKLKVLLPLGNGFDLNEFKNIAVIGGGVGIFPLIAAIRAYKDKNFYSYIGFRNKAAVCLLEEFEKSKLLKVTTDDGSYGDKGNAVFAYFSDKKRPEADVIIACGPPVMLKVLKEELEKRNFNTPCYVSLEERMGCGIGACLVCTCKKSDGDNARVCKDGPVFNIKNINL